MGKKQENRDPTDPDDDHCGDDWYHVAFDPEHPLVLAVVPGARTEENARAIVAERRLPDDVIPATVHKHRGDGRVVAVEQRQVFGPAEAREDVPGGSAASRRVNTSFVERQNRTDRGRNARKTYGSAMPGRSIRRCPT